MRILRKTRCWDELVAGDKILVLERRRALLKRENSWKAWQFFDI